MKNVNHIFKNKPYLLDEPEIEELLAYIDALEEEIIDLKFEKKNNKELILLDMVKEVLKGCNSIEKEIIESERFGYEMPNFKQTNNNLRQYILNQCDDHKIYL